MPCPRAASDQSSPGPKSNGAHLRNRTERISGSGLAPSGEAPPPTPEAHLGASPMAAAGVRRDVRLAHWRSGGRGRRIKRTLQPEAPWYPSPRSAPSPPLPSLLLAAYSVCVCVCARLQVWGWRLRQKVWEQKKKRRERGGNVVPWSPNVARREAAAAKHVSFSPSAVWEMFDFVHLTELRPATLLLVLGWTSLASS